MLINFKQLDPTIIENFYQGTGSTSAQMYADHSNRIMYGKLPPGASIGLHQHDHSSEIVYILQGSGTALYDDQSEALVPGSCHYCPPGHCHSLINDGSQDLEFFAVVPQQSTTMHPGPPSPPAQQ